MSFSASRWSPCGYRTTGKSVLTRLFLGLVGGTLGFMMGVGLTTLESALDGAAGGGRAACGNPPLPRAALDEAPSNAFCRTVERIYVIFYGATFHDRSTENCQFTMRDGAIANHGRQVRKTWWRSTATLDICRWPYERMRTANLLHIMLTVGIENLLIGTYSPSGQQTGSHSFAEGMGQTGE